MPGYLGAHTVEEFLGRAMTDQRMECHATVDYEHPTKTHLQQIEEGTTVRWCSGALIFFSNILKRSRDPDRPELPTDREAVFAWPDEFREHHDTPAHRSYLKVVARRLESDGE